MADSALKLAAVHKEKARLEAKVQFLQSNLLLMKRQVKYAHVAREERKE